jgi:predicted RNase H-like nuclease (RuvC/YqgF family)
MEQALRLAAGMGLEMARSLAAGLREALGSGPAAPALPAEDIGLLKESLTEAAERLSCHSGELESLRTENTELKGKLQILEAELVRLRKDRRELERFLLDKIKGVTT